MIKELIFSGKKYYEGTVPNYIGKSIKAPRTYIHAYQLNKWGKKHNELSVIDDPELGFSSTLPQDGDIVLAQFIQNNDIYLYFAKDDGYATAIKLSDLIQNGGVSSSPLTHLYQSLRHLLDRKVAYVFD